MSDMTRREVIAAAGGVAVCALGGGAARGEVAKGKWWIKVCGKKMEASGFDLAWGPDKENILNRRVWKKGEEEEFALPELDQFIKVYVYGKSHEKDKNVYFGVCFKDRICSKHFDFDDDEDHDVKDGDSDEWKCS